MFRAGGVDEVVQFIGISLSIKKVFTPKVGEERHKVQIEFSLFIKFTHHLLNREALLFVKVHIGAKIKLGLEIANVVVALAPNRSQAKGNIIHPVAGTKGVSSLWVPIFAKEHAALHAQGARHPGQRQRGGG